MKECLFKSFLNKRTNTQVVFQFWFILLFATQFALAQEATQAKHRYLGFGINLNNLESGIFRINCDPIKYLRTEIQFGSQKSSEDRWYTDVNGQNQKAVLDSKNTQIAIGLYGTYPYEHALFYAGVAYRQTKNSYEDLDYNSFLPFPFYGGVVNNQNSTKQFGPVIGAEYRFGNRFSLGAELGFWFVKEKNIPGYTNSVPTENTNNLTSTSLFIRFFPF